MDRGVPSLDWSRLPKLGYAKLCPVIPKAIKGLCIVSIATIRQV